MAKTQGLEKLLAQLDEIPRQLRQELAAVVQSETEALALKVAAACAVPQIAEMVRAERAANVQGREVFRSRLISGSVVGAKGHVYNSRWEEFGTSPHSLAKGSRVAIKNRDGTIRRRGKLSDAKGGWHPGARARPYFWPTVRAWKPTIKRRITAACRKAIKQAVQ